MAGMWEVGWQVRRDRTNEVMAIIEGKIDTALEDGCTRIMTRAQGVVRVRSGATRDSGTVVRIGPMNYQVKFGGAGLYLEFGTAHMPAYPFLIPSVQEEAPQIWNDVNNAVGGRGAIQIRADYLASAVTQEGGFE